MEDAADVLSVSESDPLPVDTTIPGLTCCRPRILARSSSTIVSSITSPNSSLRAPRYRTSPEMEASKTRAICMLMFSELTQMSMGLSFK